MASLDSQRGDSPRNETFLDLVRDLTMSGAKLPPIFAQIVQAQGQWVTASLALSNALSKMLVVLIPSMGGLTLAIERLRRTYSERVADKFVKDVPGGDRDAFLQARQKYQSTSGSRDDKLRAAQLTYEQSVRQKVRQEIREKARPTVERRGQDVFQSEYDAQIRRGLTEADARRQAERARLRAETLEYRNIFRRSSNARLLREAQTSARAAATSSAFTGGRLGGFLGRGVGRGLLGMGGLAGSAASLGIGAALQVAWLAGQDLWERKQKEKEGAMKKELEYQTLRNKITITGIQQESQLRQATFKAEEEMDRKRFENLRILAESKTKMNEADLAMQERLQNIEKQRLAAQKEVEILRQKVGQAKETRQHYDTYVQQEAQVRDSAQFRGGFLESMKLLFTGGAADRDIVDERGVEVDDSVKATVGSSGWFKRTQQRALTSILSTAKMARETSMAAVKADFEEFVTAYESFADTLSATTVGAMAPEIAARINKIKEDSEKWMKNSSENQVQMAAGAVYEGDFNKGVQAGLIKYDNETDHYVYQNENGITIAVKNAEEFEEDRSREGAQAAVIAKKQAEEEQKRLEEERKIAEKMLSYQQASLALVQEQVKKQEELLKNLRDAVKQGYESDMTGLFGTGNRKTGEEFYEIMANRSDELQRDAVLASRRYAGDAQAASEYKLGKDLEILKNKDERKLESAQAREEVDLAQKFKTELFAVQLNNIEEGHALALQNNTKIFQAYLDAVKQQRDAYFRMLDKQLSAEVTASTTYGRAQTEVMQEQLESRGNVTEFERQQLKNQQAMESADLDNNKKLKDMMADRIMNENVGQKSGMVENWERIQASAFGHMKDPVEMAIDSLKDNQLQNHDDLMSRLDQYLPAIAQNTAETDATALNQVRKICRIQIKTMEKCAFRNCLFLFLRRNRYFPVRVQRETPCLCRLSSPFSYSCFRPQRYYFRSAPIRVAG